MAPRESQLIRLLLVSFYYIYLFAFQLNSLFRSATPSVTWADIDGDGHSELVIGSWDGDLKVFKKNCTVVNNASSCRVAGWTLIPNATNPQRYKPPSTRHPASERCSSVPHLRRSGRRRRFRPHGVEFLFLVYLFSVPIVHR